MKKKRNNWIYLVLGVMLFSLITVTALPLVGSVVDGQQFANNSQNEIFTLSQQELTKLEAEAAGYEKVLQREPDNDTALTGLLQIRLQQKDLPGAAEPLAKLAKIHPEETEYGILLAQTKQQLSDYEGAARAYNDVLTKHPGDIYALGGISNLYVIQEMPERAIALLKKTVKLAQNETVPGTEINREAVELLLGELYTKEQRYGEAITLYDRLAAANQEDFRPLLGKALVFEKQSKLAEAKPILEKAYVAAPETYKDQIGNIMERIVAQQKLSQQQESSNQSPEGS